MPKKSTKKASPSRSGHGYLMRFPEETWDDMQALSDATSTPVNQLILNAVHSYMVETLTTPKVEAYYAKRSARTQRVIARIQSRKITEL